MDEDKFLLETIHTMLNDSGYSTSLGWFSEIRLHHIVALLVFFQKYDAIAEVVRLYPEGKSLQALIEYGTYPQEIEIVRHLKFIFLPPYHGNLAK